MGSRSEHEREVRAARNQALFRSVNERLETLNAAFESARRTMTIACECDDTTCIEMIEVDADDYRVLRGEPRQFVVLADHVAPDVEVVVREMQPYVVVEKIGRAGEVAEDVAAANAPRR